MPLLNYTTDIAADKSIAEIQKCLAVHGASSILANYDDQGQIVALDFMIPIEGNSVSFRLPNDWRPVLKILEDEKKVPRSKKTKEQALRVSWRILKDWTLAQMAIVETRMVKMDQVFLPYAIVRDGRTLYETVKTSNLLSAPASNAA